MIIVVVIRMLA